MKLTIKQRKHIKELINREIHSIKNVQYLHKLKMVFNLHLKEFKFQLKEFNKKNIEPRKHVKEHRLENAENLICILEAFLELA